VLSAFAAALAVTLVAAAAVAAAVVVARRRGPRPSTAPQRVPVLGGEQPPTHAWSRYHARYYPMALVFVAFEMEMMFMYPWAAAYVAEGGKALVEMGMFLAILSVGLVYAWREGAFRWQ